MSEVHNKISTVSTGSTEVAAGAGATPLSQAEAVGQGFNIYGSYDFRSLISPLFDPAKAKTKTFNFLGKEYTIPEYVTAIESTAGDRWETFSETRDEYQSSLATHAKVEASYGPFSGSFEASFSKEVRNNNQFYFAANNAYFSLAHLGIGPNPSKYLTDKFLQSVNALPSKATPENMAIFSEFFETYGIYYTSGVTIGASMDYTASLRISSSLSTQDFSAMLTAAYKGLFVSGSISAEVKSSQTWQSYSKNSSVHIRAMGGDVTLIAQLAQLDPTNPSKDTVNLFNRWSESIKSSPAIVDFKLSPIWSLCGAKETAVRQAWDMYGPIMRPRLALETSNRRTPVLTIGRLIKPSKEPNFKWGYQMVILSARDLTSNDGILLNKYYSFNRDTSSWWRESRSMFAEMQADLMPFLSTDNLVVVASFLQDRNCPPTSEFYALLRSCGAGSNLKQWIDNCNPGSSWWCPTNYSMVGFINSGPDAGIEVLSTGPSWSNPLSTESDALFYRLDSHGKYTMGRGNTRQMMAVGAEEPGIAFTYQDERDAEAKH